MFPNFSWDQMVLNAGFQKGNTIFGQLVILQKQYGGAREQSAG